MVYQNYIRSNHKETILFFFSKSQVGNTISSSVANPLETFALKSDFSTLERRLCWKIYRDYSYDGVNLFTEQGNRKDNKNIRKNIVKVLPQRRRYNFFPYSLSSRSANKQIDFPVYSHCSFPHRLFSQPVRTGSLFHTKSMRVCVVFVPMGCLATISTTISLPPLPTAFLLL